MLNLGEELERIVEELNAREIPFALCGGIAMAIHGFTRATEDIDLFVPPESLSALEQAVAGLGYTVKALPMTFAEGAMEIRRISKIDPADGDLLMLDLLLVTAATQEVWIGRQMLQWLGKPFPVVSREGLIALKRFRSSKQDLVDIERLESDE